MNSLETPHCMMMTKTMITITMMYNIINYLTSLSGLGAHSRDSRGDFDIIVECV